MRFDVELRRAGESHGAQFVIEAVDQAAANAVVASMASLGGNFEVSTAVPCGSGHSHGGLYEPAGALADHEANFPHGGIADWGDITNKPATFPPEAHNHAGTYEPANANIQAHVAAAHAPSNAQKNSDITKAEVEAVLTGVVASHSHAGGAGAAWTTVKKTASEARTASATLTADNTLVVALSAATRYRIYISAMLTTANATMDYKYDCNYTGTVTSIHCVRRHAAAGAIAGTDNENTLAGAVIVPSTAVAATTTGVAYVEIEVIILTLTAGTFQFRWAQNTSDLGALTVLAGSYLEHMTL